MTKAAKTLSFVPLGGDLTAGDVVLVPGAEVPLLPIDLPQGLRGRAREQVAWRQLRDAVGLGPQQVEMHPYAGPNKAEDSQRVLVVDGAQMARWRGTAKAKALLPDYLALPAAPGLWVLAFAKDSLRARLDVTDGFSCEGEMGALMLTQALAAAEPPPRAVLLTDGTAPDWLGALLTEHDIPLLTDQAALKDQDLPAPQVLAHGELAADLRSDPRAARDRLRRRVLPWRWPIVAGGLVAAIWAFELSLETQRLEQDAAALRTEMTAIVRDRFVPTGPILDIRTQVSRALAAQQAQATATSQRVSPLVLFGQVSDVLNGSEAVVDTAQYSPATGLALDARLPDFAAVDRLVVAFESAGISVDLQDARSTGTNREVRANLRLRPTAEGEDG